MLLSSMAGGRLNDNIVSTNHSSAAATADMIVFYPLNSGNAEKVKGPNWVITLFYSWMTFQRCVRVCVCVWTIDKP